jgi:hypothetical protein
MKTRLKKHHFAGGLEMALEWIFNFFCVLNWWVFVRPKKQDKTDQSGGKWIALQAGISRLFLKIRQNESMYYTGDK